MHRGPSCASSRAPSTPRWKRVNRKFKAVTTLAKHARWGPVAGRAIPAPLPDGSLNRLGLVNFMGVVAIAVCGPLALSARPLVRRRCYHAFRRLHMPVALLFVTCCALHDLPILEAAARTETRRRRSVGAPSIRSS